MWLKTDGSEFDDADWKNGTDRCIGFLLSGEAGEYHLTAGGEPEPDTSFLVVMNAGDAGASFQLTDVFGEGEWLGVIDTAVDHPAESIEVLRAGEKTVLAARSLKVFEFLGRD